MLTPNCKPFGTFTCVDDTAVRYRGPFTVFFRVHFDQDTKPTDYECYDEAQIAAWRNDEWHYAGLVASVHIDGMELDDHAWSLWGIDCGLNPKGDGEYFNELCEDALNEIDFAAIADRLAQAAFKVREALTA